MPDKIELPFVRDSISHQFYIHDPSGRARGYIHVSEHEGRPVEVFLNITKAGSTLRGLTDLVGSLIGKQLRLGLPLEDVIDGAIGTIYEPAGPTDNPEVPFCTSLADYVARWLAVRYLTTEQYEALVEKAMVSLIGSRNVPQDVISPQQGPAPVPEVPKPLPVHDASDPADVARAHRARQEPRPGEPGTVEHVIENADDYADEAAAWNGDDIIHGD